MVATVTFEVKGAKELQAALGRLRRIAPEECRKEVANIAKDIRNDAVENVAVDTGITRANIKFWSDDDYKTATIGVDAEHATTHHRTKGKQSFVRFGSGEVAMIAAIIEFGHGIIYPKKGKFLRWKGKDGKWVFARSVKAQPPRPFLVPAFQRYAPELVKKITASIITIIKRSDRASG
jgi:hypothetical protein